MTGAHWDLDDPTDDTGREVVPWDGDRPDGEDAEADDALVAELVFRREVNDELHKLRVRRKAREQFEAERAAEADVPAFDSGLLADILARPAEPPHRVRGLIPSDGGTLVVAQRKCGKTTFLLNLAQDLIRGGMFLGRFAVRPVTGRVAILNYEVSAAQLGRWAQEVDVPQDRLLLVNLRGRRNPLSHPEDRAALAELLRTHNVETLVVDPFGRAYTGQSQNDPGEVGAWLADLDRFARAEAGASDLILSAHAGWDGERTRGASALEDWADSIIYLVRDRDDKSIRYMHATGRDVDVEEDRLHYDEVQRHLSLTGTGSRRARAATQRHDELVDAVIDAVTAEPGINGSQLGPALRERGLSFQKGDERKAARAAVDAGKLRVERGARAAHHYFPTQVPRPAPTSPDGARPTYPDPSFIGGVGREDRSSSDLPQPDEARGIDLDTVLGPACPTCNYRQGHAPTCNHREAS